MFSAFHILAQLIWFHFTGICFGDPGRAPLCRLNSTTDMLTPSSLDLCLVGLRTLPYGILAAFDPVSSISGSDFRNRSTKMSYSKALTSAVRELLGKNKSNPEIVSTRAPIGFVTENSQTPQANPQGTIIDDGESQPHLNIESTSVEGDSSPAGENGNDGRVEGNIGVEKTGQELEGEPLYDDLEFPIIKRQL